jgi:hypothetical protein
VNPTNNKVLEIKDRKDEEGQTIIVGDRKGSDNKDATSH